MVGEEGDAWRRPFAEACWGTCRGMSLAGAEGLALEVRGDEAD